MITWNRHEDQSRFGEYYLEAYVGKWRCRAWCKATQWQWEVRSFGRGAIHVSGEAEHKNHAKLIAVAAAKAIAGVRGRG